SAYVAWQQRREQGDLEAAAADSARYFDRLDDFDAGLTGTQLERLLASRAATAGLATASRQPETGAPLDVVVLRAVRTIANRLLPYGVLDVPKDSVLTTQIAVVNPDERTEVLIPRQDVYGYNDAYTAAANELNVRFPNRPDT